MNTILSKINKGLVVSCQALSDEPLHSSFIMGKMAKAASEGGAVGIRANSYEDIIEIKKNVDLPIIGIVKRDYDDSEVYITPTMLEVDELMKAGVDIIALDATSNIRPYNLTLDTLISQIKDKYPNVLLMADCSNIDEVKNACVIDFDIISSTLTGYTSTSIGLDIAKDDFKLLKEMIKITHDNNKYFIAEGNMNTPSKARRALELGADSVVVGSMITRPQVITNTFVKEINS